MNPDMQTIRRKLVRLATNKKTAYYYQVAGLIGMGPRNPKFLRILDDINRQEDLEGRPLLSAVVVLSGQSKRRTISSSGFFKLAEDLKKYDGGDKVEFWNAEIERVYSLWSRYDGGTLPA